ncbi:MAG: CvpA family protein, partial [Chloroflexi bacterium]|nr:CvpA family protein [Chloroflexota bacterium]
MPAAWGGELALNWLDGVVLLVLLVSALDGLRRGLLLGVLDLAAAAAGVVFAVIFERPVGEWLASTVSSVPSALAQLAAFLGILILVQVVIGATVGRLFVAIVRVLTRIGLGGLDRLLGLVPGLARGVITV